MFDENESCTNVNLVQNVCILQKPLEESRKEYLWISGCSLVYIVDRRGSRKKCMNESKSLTSVSFSSPVFFLCVLCKGMAVPLYHHNVAKDAVLVLVAKGSIPGNNTTTDKTLLQRSDRYLARGGF